MGSGVQCVEQSVKPDINPDLACGLIKQYFGCNVRKIRQLDGYFDVNYLAEVEDGNGARKFVFKVLNSRDSVNTAHIQAQHEAMTFLSSKGFHCPAHQVTSDGALFSIVGIPGGDDVNSKLHAIRLLTYVEGTLLSDVKPTESVLFQAGSFVGRVQQQLKEFSHPGLLNAHCIWFLTCIPDLKGFLYTLDDEMKRQELAVSVIKAFETEVMPLWNELEKGVIHGDAFTHNILCRPTSDDDDDESFELHGLIDFGAIHEGCYVFELAIIMCYMMLESIQHGSDIDALVASGHVLRGYLSERKVPEIEMEILRTCMAGRLCQSLVLGAYTYSQDPSNEYALTTSKAGWSLLERLWLETTEEQMRGLWSSEERNAG